VQDVRSHGRSPQMATSDPPEEQQQKTLAAFRGPYVTVARENVSIFWRELFEAGLIFALLPQIFGKFLLGLYVGREQYIHNIAHYASTLRRAAPWLLLAGVTGSAVSVASRMGATHPSRSAQRHLDRHSSTGDRSRRDMYVGLLCLLHRVAAAKTQMGESAGPVGPCWADGPDELLDA